MSGTRRPVIRINRPVPERVAPVRAPRLRIGLLGGSFNPAHQGHLAISLEALKRLKLDRVWWLVSPQNPLKPSDETADLEKRLARARKMARHPRLMVRSGSKMPGRMTVANEASGSSNVNSIVVSSIAVTDSRTGARQPTGAQPAVRAPGELESEHDVGSGHRVAVVECPTSRSVQVQTISASSTSRRSAARSGTGVSVASYWYRPVPMKAIGLSGRNICVRVRQRGDLTVDDHRDRPGISACSRARFL